MSDIKCQHKAFFLAATPTLDLFKSISDNIGISNDRGPNRFAPSKEKPQVNSDGRHDCCRIGRASQALPTAKSLGKI